jgi:outer membrane protein assembly factor BamB
MAKTTIMVPIERIQRAIHIIRGEKVILDSDLAGLYGVTTARLNQQFNRNRNRFPEDFVFRLTRDEFSSLMLQNATSKKGRGGRRKLPYAFSEHGALMAANILSGQRAVDASVQVVRAFIRLREILASNAQLAHKLEELEKKYDARFRVVFDAIRQLMTPPVVNQTNWLPAQIPQKVNSWQITVILVFVVDRAIYHSPFTVYHSPMLRYLLVLLLFSPSVIAQDWNQWRGPSRDGVVPAANAPATWPASLKRTWRVEIGEGYSSPVVSGGTVFVHSRRDPEEIVMAIKLADGKVIWQQKYQADFKKNQYAVKMAKGPNATPLVMGNRLFTLGVTGILNAWDTATGKQLWTKDFSSTVDTSKMFCGTAASPIAVDGRLVVQTGSDIHGGQIQALEPSTGKGVWEWKGLGPGYASPVVINIPVKGQPGIKQIVTLTNGSLVGLDPGTGRELWSAPFPDEWHENIVTPLWTGSRLIVSGPRQGTHAFAIVNLMGKWSANELWKNPDVAMYMSSPVYGDGLIYGLSEKKKGQFVALDETTGAVRWITEGREGDHASILLTPRNVIYLTNGADLIVAQRDGHTFSVDKRYDVADSETWSVPVFLGSDLLVRDSTGLMRLAAGQ